MNAPSGERRKAGEYPKIGKAAAAELSELLMRHTAECNEFLAARQASLPKEEFDALKRLVGRAMGEIFLEALCPIFEAYPDLKPCGLDPQRQGQGR